MNMRPDTPLHRHAQLFELLRQKSMADQITRRIRPVEGRAPSRGDTTLIKLQAMRSLRSPRPSHA